MDGLVLLLIACLGINGVLSAIVSNVSCTQNTWLRNTSGQTPCYVFAELMGQCYAGNFTITYTPDRTGLKFIQPGPANLDIPCYCSTVQYYLLSACSNCLGFQTGTWAQYVSECDSVVPTIGLPAYPIPAGVDIPDYAMLQSTQDFDLMLADQILLDGIEDSSPTSTVPVLVSGTLIGAVVEAAGSQSTSWITTQTIFASTSTTHGTSTSSTTSSRTTVSSPTSVSQSDSAARLPFSPASPTSTASSTTPALPTNPADSLSPTSTNNNRMRAIIGGSVAGGICLLAALIGLVIFCRRRRSQRRSEYRVSIISRGVMSPPPPTPAPWFSPMPTPAPPPMSQSIVPEPETLRSTLYHLGSDALPYASPSSPSPGGPSRTVSGYTEDEKRSTGFTEDKAGEKWVRSGVGYSFPEEWSPLPPYQDHASTPPVVSTGSSNVPCGGAFAQMQKREKHFPDPQ